MFAPVVALFVALVVAWPPSYQARFLRQCENPTGDFQGSRVACVCLLTKFEALFPPLPWLPLGVSYLTRPPVPFWYSDNKGKCGVG